MVLSVTEPLVEKLQNAHAVKCKTEKMSQRQNIFQGIDHKFGISNTVE